MNSFEKISIGFLGVVLLVFLGFVGNSTAEEPNPDKLITDIVHSTPISYNADLFNTPLGIGTGIPGITASANINNSSTWEYYRFCGNAGDVVDTEVHRTTSAMDPARQTCEGTTADSVGIFAFATCGPSMGPFIGAADDNNGILHGVGGIFADPINMFVLPATDEYTLMVFDFIPAGAPPVFEIHVAGVSLCLACDIKPGSDPNSINTKSNGVVPVAILGSATFDVSNLDVTILEFNPDAASPAHDLTDPVVYANHLQDVNGDSFTDLVSHYRQKDTGIAVNDTDACVTAALIGGGTSGVCCDSVNVVK